MPFRFNQLLQDVAIAPNEVRLLRHQASLGRGRSLFEIWRADRAIFDDYQSIQPIAKRASLARPYWAAFFGTWDGQTVFGGIYEAGHPMPLDKEVLDPVSRKNLTAGSVDRYPIHLTDHLADYSGRLFIEWGGGSSGRRSWNQRADAQDKLITELQLHAAERPFPGFMAIASPLSLLMEAPSTWVQRLSETGGVYLLACPRTGELYVGSATAAGGFWSRWQEYRRNGHGGNVALVDREPTDWRVSILQVAGSADSIDEILAMEVIWKAKLQTRVFGLTRN